MISVPGSVDFKTPLPSCNRACLIRTTCGAASSRTRTVAIQTADIVVDARANKVEAAASRPISAVISSNEQ